MTTPTTWPAATAVIVSVFTSATGATPPPFQTTSATGNPPLNSKGKRKSGKRKKAGLGFSFAFSLFPFSLSRLDVGHPDERGADPLERVAPGPLVPGQPVHLAERADPGVLPVVGLLVVRPERQRDVRVTEPADRPPALDAPAHRPWVHLLPHPGPVEREPVPDHRPAGPGRGERLPEAEQDVPGAGQGVGRRGREPEREVPGVLALVPARVEPGDPDPVQAVGGVEQPGRR